MLHAVMLIAAPRHRRWWLLHFNGCTRTSWMPALTVTPCSRYAQHQVIGDSRSLGCHRSYACIIHHRGNDQTMQMLCSAGQLDSKTLHSHPRLLSICMCLHPSPLGNTQLPEAPPANVHVPSRLITMGCSGGSARLQWQSPVSGLSNSPTDFFPACLYRLCTLGHTTIFDASCRTTSA